MQDKKIDLNKVQSVLKVVDRMLEIADTTSSKYNILLFLKSYSYYLMEKNEESLWTCDRLLENSYRLNFNKDIVCQAYNLKTMIYLRNSEFSNMYDSIKKSLAIDETNTETHELFSIFKEKLLC